MREAEGEDLLIVMGRILPHPTLKAALVALLLMVAFFQTGCEFLESAEKREERIFRNARPIQEALRKHFDHEGKYPSQLSELSKGYIKDIPKPQWGVNAWEYEASEDQASYILRVRERKDFYMGYTYSSYSAEWDADF